MFCDKYEDILNTPLFSNEINPLSNNKSNVGVNATPL